MTKGIEEHYRQLERAIEHSVAAATDADRFQASPMEQALRTMESGKLERLRIGGSVAFLGRTVGGARSVYKPGWLEALIDGSTAYSPLRYGIPWGAGQLAAREVAAYRVSAALRDGLVPPTSFADGFLGPGSNQLWVFSTPSHPKAAQLRLPQQRVAPEADQDFLRVSLDELRVLNGKYPKLQREQMAILDYVIGNTDRHWLNYRTGRSGEIVAIDHQLSFPEFPDSRIGIRSDFVKEFHDSGEVFSEEVMRNVRAVDLDRLRAALSDAGLSDKAVKGALDRLIEIRTHGKITGEAWPGPIQVGNRFLPRTAQQPTGWIETWHGIDPHSGG